MLYIELKLYSTFKNKSNTYQIYTIRKLLDIHHIILIQTFNFLIIFLTLFLKNLQDN